MIAKQKFNNLINELCKKGKLERYFEFLVKL